MLMLLFRERYRAILMIILAQRRERRDGAARRTMPLCARRGALLRAIMSASRDVPQRYARLPPRCSTIVFSPPMLFIFVARH
jgi:hypothetical protein